MKTQGRAKTGKFHVSAAAAICAASLAVCVTLVTTAAAEDIRTNSTAAASTRTDPARSKTQTSSTITSEGVADILKMADAGVSKGVITAYIENSDRAYKLTHEDIIALKKHNVDDEVVTLMLKRGAQIRAAVTQARNDALARALASRDTAGGGFDPEGYDYFQYHYLQPRALQSAYERLGPYYYYPPVPYAYGRPFGYR